MQPQLSTQPLFSGPSELAKLMGSYDWAQTSLGAIATWPSALKSTLGILLNADTPMFCVWGCDRILFYNDSYLTLLQEKGYQLSVGKPLSQNTKAWESIVFSVESVFTTGQPIHGRPILELEHANNNIIHTWSYSALWNEAGQVEGVFATGSKIFSEILNQLPSAQAETVLEKSEARFHQIADLSPIMIRILALDGSGAWFNQRWHEFTGQSLETALGQGWLAAVHPEDLAEIQQQFLEAQQQQALVRLEYRLRRQDGTYCWVVDSAVPWFDNAGIYQGYIGSIVDISDCKINEVERQQAEVALRESEALVQSILDSSNDCIKVLTPEGQLLYINKGGLSVLDIDDPATILNACWIDFWQGKDYEQAKSTLAAAKTGAVGHMQGYCPTSAGRPKWWDIVATPLRDVSGQINKLVVISRDITEHRQANEALRENERSLSTLISNLPGFVFRSLNDEDWTMVFISEGVQEITGYAAQDFLDGLVTWESLVHPGDLETVQFNAARHIEEKTSIRITYRIIDATGRVRWVWDRATPVFSETNEIAFWEGFVTDITDRKEAEMALQISEERYRLLNSTLSAIVWTMNDEGHFVMPQSEWEFYTGQVWDDYRGLGWLQAIHPDDRQKVWAQWHLAKERRTTYVAEGRLWNAASKTYRYFETRGMPVFNPDGSIREWVGNVADVHDRKASEQEREQLLQRERLAREEAEQANQIKDQFLAVLSHELRSPLNPILGWSRLLQTRKFNEAKTTEALATIERNARLQSQLVDDLLDLAKILRGKLHLNNTPVYLTFVIEAAIEAVKTAAMAKAIDLHLDLDPQVQVWGDAARLQQIFWNLLSNAIKFTPEQGQVSIGLQQIDTQAQIIVGDTGSGISSDFLPYIFESFRQEDVSITRKHGGLGLGLAIVRQLVEAHGGTIVADSPGEGKGAIFTVQLPVLNANLNRNLAERQPEQDVDLSGIQVLVVDDSSDTRELLKILLEQYGAEVLVACSAVEALEILATFCPHVLVSDIGMPEMDGYQLIQQVRALPTNQGGQVPAIALTAYAQLADQQQAFKSGYQRHLSKPLELEKLIETVSALVR